MQLAVVMSGTIIALTCGWLLLPSFTAPLPVPAWLIPVTPVVKQDMTKDIAHVVMRDSEALSVLYGVWGYEVPADSAWCDQAVRAGLVCKSGNASLQTLVNQNLPPGSHRLKSGTKNCLLWSFASVMLPLMYS